MCNDCVKVLSPDQVIKGCCIVKDGYYCIWNLNHMTLVCEEWAELCDLYNVLRQISHITFNVVSERQRARNALNNLKREAPFSECKRFPWRKTYVNISCSIYGTLFQNILGALDYKDRETEKELRYGKDREQKDPDQTASASSSIDDAKTAYRNNIKGLLNELCKKNEIYDRIKFETKYDLRWCDGPCPTEPNVENPPGGEPPKQPENPDSKTYGRIMKHLEERGLEPEDYSVFTEEQMKTNRFECNKSLQRLGPALEKNILPTGAFQIYVFTTGEYSKCGSENPMKGFVYNPTIDTFTGETVLKPNAFNDVDELVHLINRVLDDRDEDQEIKSINSEKSHRSINSQNRDNEDQRNYRRFQPRRHYNYRNRYYNYGGFNGDKYSSDRYRSPQKKSDFRKEEEKKVSSNGEQSSGELI